MASKSKKLSGRRSVRRKDKAWHDFLYGDAAKNAAIAAAAVGAIYFLNDSVFRPVYTSGPPPFPSRAEVDLLRLETDMNFDGINKGITETLETAKAARQAAQQAVQTSQDQRLTRLLALKTELEAKLAASPNDQILIQVLAQTNVDIAKATAASAVAAK